MLIEGKEAGRMSFAPNLLKQNPATKTLFELFDRIASPDWLQFQRLPGGAETELMISASVSTKIPEDPEKGKGLQYLYSSTSFNGNRITIDTSPVSINEQRKSWVKGKNHPDVILWAEVATDNLVLYGKGEYVGVSGLWTPDGAGGRYLEEDPAYCNYIGRRAFEFFEDELKLAAIATEGVHIIRMQALSMTEPPIDWYSNN